MRVRLLQWNRKRQKIKNRRRRLMKQFKHIGRTLLQGLFEYVLLFPVVLMIGIVLQQYLNFPLLYWLIALPIALMVGIVFRSVVQNKKWWLYALISLITGL